MTDEMLRVGALARRTGVTVRTLHHYDEIGLLRPSARTDAGHRFPGPDDISRLYQIVALRSIGLPLDAIGAVLDEAAKPSSPSSLAATRGSDNRSATLSRPTNRPRTALGASAKRSGPTTPTR